MAFRILVTGSRDWSDRAQLRSVLEPVILAAPPPVVVVHGAARGADMLAGALARELLGPQGEEKHPADWRRHGKAAGGIRNQVMVDRGADVCIAFPLPGSIGTWDCVRRAREAGIPVAPPVGVSS